MIKRLTFRGLRFGQIMAQDGVGNYVIREQIDEGGSAIVDAAEYPCRV